MGIEFECDQRRIGLVNSESFSRDRAVNPQLVLQFSSDFEVIQKTPALSVQIRKGSTSAEQAFTAEPSIRVKFG